MSIDPYAGKTLVAFDTETHLIRPGLLAPRLVCGSWKEGRPSTDPRAVAGMGTRQEVIDRFRKYLQDPDVLLGGANIAYDNAVLAVADPSLLELIFRVYEEDRVVDTHILEALGDIYTGTLFKHFRTMSPIGRYSVEYLAEKYLGLDLAAEKRNPNAWRLRYAELDGLPLEQYPEAACLYSLGDADHELAILQAQRASCQNQFAAPDQMRAAWSLHLMALRGVRTDPVAVEKLGAELEVKHRTNQAMFFRAGLLKITSCALLPADSDNPGAPRERQPADLITLEDLALASADAEWLPAARKAIEKGKPVRYGGDKKALIAKVTTAYQGNPPRNPPTDREPNGSVKTDRDTLSESGDDLLDEYGGSTNVSKLRGTYLPVLRAGKTVPINAKFNALVETTRSSCGEPNLQNPPRKGGIRECFCARPGCVWCSVDYGALEMCTLAQVCIWKIGWSKIAESINAGEDQHWRLTGRLLGRSWREVEAAGKAGDKYLKNVRQACKAANFGFPGGMGVPKFVLTKRKEGLRLCEVAGRAERCGSVPYVMKFGKRDIAPTCPVCLDVGNELRNAWFNEWEEMSTYFEMVSAETDGPEGGWLTLPGSEVVRGQVGFCDGANGYFQALAAHGAKRALWQVTRECYVQYPNRGSRQATKETMAFGEDWTSPLYGSSPVIFLHDEIITEMPEATASEAAERQAKVQVEQMSLVCPDVKIKAEPALMRTWQKEAELVRDANGHLVPWEPKAKAT